MFWSLRVGVSLAHGVVVWALWVLAVFSHVTVVQRVVTIWQRLSTDDRA